MSGPDDAYYISELTGVPFVDGKWISIIFSMALKLKICIIGTSGGRHEEVIENTGRIVFWRRTNSRFLIIIANTGARGEHAIWKRALVNNRAINHAGLQFKPLLSGLFDLV